MTEEAEPAVAADGAGILAFRGTQSSSPAPLLNFIVRPGRSERGGSAMPGKVTTVPEDNRILFYERDREAFGFLSNFHLAPVEIDGEVWQTVEHFYQAQKSIDPAYRQAIREAATPGRAKRLGASSTAPRRLSLQSWFRRNQKASRADWQEVRLEVMRRAVRAKFVQNRDMAELLLATGTTELLEDSATDPFWGVGPDGRGLNWLGRTLMEVREELAAARGA